MVPAWQYGYLGMKARRGSADWKQCSHPQHHPVSFICFISIARSIARSFNSQELSKSFLKHLFKGDSQKIWGWKTLSGAGDSCKITVSFYPSRNIQNLQVTCSEFYCKSFFFLLLLSCLNIPRLLNDWNPLRKTDGLLIISNGMCNLGFPPMLNSVTQNEYVQISEF